MGTFNYFVDIDKDVDIDVNIDFNVDKFVQSFTNIEGYLAVAEASADAFATEGGTGTGRRETADRAFLIDGFDDQQEVDINPGADALDIFDEGTAVGPTFINPDGETFASTDIPIGASLTGAPQRYVSVENVPITGVVASVSGVRIDAGNAASSARIVTDTSTLADAIFRWEADIDGDGNFGETGVTDDAFSVLVDCPIEATPPFDPDDCEIDLDDLLDVGFNNLLLENVNFNAENGTLRVEAEIEDADGTISTVAAYAASSDYVAKNPGLTTPSGDSLNAFVVGQDILIPLGTFTQDLPATTPGDELRIDFGGGNVVNEGFYAVGRDLSGGDGALDLENVVRIEFKLLGDISNSDEFDTAAPNESPTTSAYDVEFDLAEINSQCVCEDFEAGQGALSETETFAQVDSVTGFTEAFSMSLAAANSADFDFI